MKSFYLFTLLYFGLAYGQKPCEFATNVTDSVGTYRETRDYLVYERNFAGLSSSVFFSLAQTDGMPTLNVQFLDKSKEFIKARCLDKNAKMFLQLDNGKIVTLLHIDQNNCGTVVRDSTGSNHRVMTGVFMFLKGTMDDLKDSPVSVMRIRYAAETSDYIFRSEFLSEIDNKIYTPGRYFIDNLHCLEI